MLTALLARSGYAVVEAEDGQDGLGKFRTEAVDLVVTDIIMPEQDGTGVIIELQKMKKAVPIIAISGGGRNTGNEYLRIAMVFGAKKVFAKPLDIEVFLEAVKELLGQ